MASEKDATCENDPNFAIICAFFQKFSTMLNIGHPDIQLLKEWFENTDEVSPGLKDLHIKLLRKLRKTVHETAWETALAKFCYIYSSQDAWEIERFGYKKSSLKVKLRILKELLEYQFDKNGKFRTHFSALSAADLRGQPIGRDKLGHSYWLTQDRHCNIRIYQEHLDEEIWQVVASNREELVTLIKRLKGNEVVLPSLVSVVDEDSSSNSCPAVVVKLPPPEEQDESLDDKTSSSEGKIPNIKIKLDTSKILASTNGDADDEEVESDSESEYRGEDDVEDPDLDGFASEDEKVASNGKVEKEEVKEDNNDNTVKHGKLNGDLNGAINGIVKDKDKDVEKEIDKKSSDGLDSSNLDERKVKPIVISQSKITNDKVSKKRLLEDQEIPTEDDNPSKKTRPTLLGNNREKKISKYEKFKDESEDDEEEDGEEDEDEEDGTEEDEEAAAEEGEEEEEEELGEEEEDDEVGEEIEEDVMVIKCDGNGKECESSYLDLLKLSEDLNDDSWVGEEIEEDVMIVTGEGWGNNCLVGNSKDDENKEEVCFEKQNCGKVSVIKKDCTEISNSKNRKFSNDQEEEIEKGITDESVDELTNGEKASKNNANVKMFINSKNDNSVEKDHKSPSPVSDKEYKTPEVPKIEITEVIESEKPVNSMGDIEESQVKVPETPQVCCEKSENDSKPPSPAEVSQKETTNTVLPNRKRRLSEERPRPVSESESDLNSEIVEEQSQEDVDIGGKRPKMRCKIINASMRKKVEAERNDVNKESSSSEEEHSLKEKEKESLKKISHKDKENEKNEDPSISKKEEEAEELVPETETDKKLEQIKEDSKHVESEEKEEDKNIVKESPKADNKCAETPEDSSKKETITEELSTMPKIPPPLEELEQIQTRSGRKKPAVPFQIKRRRRGKKPKNEEKQEDEKQEDEKQEDEKQEDEKQEDKKQEEKKQEVEKEEDDKHIEEPAAKVEKPVEPPDLPEISKEASPVSNNNSNSSNELPETKTVTPPTSTDKEAVKRKQRKKREIDISNIIEADNDVTPVRQSRRIAQLKIKEEAERRKLEEIALKKMKEELKKKKKEEKKNAKDEPEISEKSDSSSDKNDSLYSEIEIKKKVEKKKRGLKKGGWSSGTEDEPEEEEEEFQYETDVGSPLFKSDHEFSPESDIEDESQIVPTKRARTARKEGEEGGADIEVSDEACQKCGKADHPEWILLCDKCDKGYHCSCLSPVLFIIPEGDWFCPPCQQEQLILALENHLKDFDELIIQKKEEEEIRVRNLVLEKERLELLASMPAPVKQPRNKPGRRIRKNSSFSSRSNSSRSERSSSKSSGSSSGSSSSSSSSRSSATDSEDEPIYKLRKRRQINVSYRFHEYDDLINSAIKEEMDEVAGAGNLGRGKDISTIIEADKEEKLRLKQLEAQKEVQASLEPNEVKPTNIEITVNPAMQTNEQTAEAKTEQAIKEDSGSDFEPMKVKPKVSSRRSLKKKNRKLNSLDISSDDDGSDEDFKTSSYDTEEDESISAGGSESDSSLEIYKHKSKKNKKNSRRSSRRAARNRKKRYDDDFIVDDSDFSEEFPKTKKKRKQDSDYTESESEEGLSEDLDSDDLCDDSTDSDSDGAWQPSKRKKQRTSSKKKQQKNISSSSRKQKKHRRPDNEKSFKAGISKNRIPDYDDDDNSRDSSRKTRGRRFTYLEDYEDESSDDGIKPGVKRPDTPPEEREKFIRRQEEIKRMLAEKNTEAAKVAATPTLAPIARSNRTDQPADSSASLSTVPLSVIRSAKALDIEYLQRRGELESEDNETDFDDDLPDDFNPEDMDEEEIAKMMEEEDFAQHQLKLAGEVIRQKKLKETDPPIRIEEIRIPRATPAPIYDTTRKRFPIPTPHPPLRNPPFGQFSHPSYGRSSMFPNRSLPLMHSNRSMLPPPLQANPSSIHANPLVPQANSNPTVQAISPVPNSQIPTVVSQASPHEPLKPRGRRKKITPLRDTLQKQQAAAAAAAAAAATSLSGMPPGQAKPTTGASGPIGQAGPPLQAALLTKDPAGGDKVAGPNLSVAQPPQLYKPSNTQPSVITRMAQPASRSRFSEQGSRFFGPPGAMGQRPPPTRPPPMSVAPPHHTMRPSYASGPPPLRPVNNASSAAASLGNGIGRHAMPPRQPPPFASSEQFNMRPRTAPPLNPYRPPLFGTPGYPPVPPGHAAPPGPPPPQPPSSLHSADNAYSAPSFATAPFGNFYPPPIGSTHSTPPPPTATAVPSSVIVSATANPTSPPPPVVPSAVAESMQQSISPRPKATPLETFDSKSTPPPDIDSARSPYDTNSTPADENDEENVIRNSTSEFSGLVSYFSSQQDDLNT